jgi:hypothetical protein
MSGLRNINLAPRLLLLIGVFLAAQSLALAHEFDHLATGDGNSCVICPAGSNLQAAATNSIDLFELTAPAATRPVCPNHLSKATISSGFSARAPPSFH